MPDQQKKVGNNQRQFDKTRQLFDNAKIFECRKFGKTQF